MKKRVSVVLFCGVILGTAALFFFGARSPAFSVRSVLVENHPAGAPVTAATVKELAGIRPGFSNLFWLDLQEVEKRILKNDWIKAVRLRKEFPATLALTVSFREPAAIFQKADGDIAYVDNEGAVFGKVDLVTRGDLPVFSGFKGVNGTEPKTLLKEAVAFSEQWEKGNLNRVSRVSAIAWDTDRGLRASLVYSLKGTPQHARTTLELGMQPVGKDTPTWRIIDSNLEKVLRYLSNNSISAHQIFVGDGKKIVVRTAPGS